MATADSLAVARVGQEAASKYCFFKVLHNHPSFLKRVKGELSRGSASDEMPVRTFEPLQVSMEQQHVLIRPAPRDSSTTSTVQSMSVINGGSFAASVHEFHCAPNDKYRLPTMDDIDGVGLGRVVQKLLAAGAFPSADKYLLADAFLSDDYQEREVLHKMEGHSFVMRRSFL